MFCVILPVSRVLSWTVINLRRPSPIGFGPVGPVPPWSMRRADTPYGVASDRVYSKSMLPWKWVSSYLAFPSLPFSDDRKYRYPRFTQNGGLLLLHFPDSRLWLTLSAILPCEARTFLTVIPFGTIPRNRPARLRLYYSTPRALCQASIRIRRKYSSMPLFSISADRPSALRQNGDERACKNNTCPHSRSARRSRTHSAR